MKEKPQTQLAVVRAILKEATRLNDNGQHGAALKQAHQASEHVAVAYLSVITGQLLPPNDTTFELFYETIQEPKRHTNLLTRIEDVIGDVYVLREAYEPATLNETLPQDAEQMIDRVTALFVLVDKIVGHC
jgi:hypothetical protein